MACTNDICSRGTCVSTDNCPGGLTCDHGTGQCTSGPRTTSFQQGVNGYTDVVDTYIDAALGDQSAMTPIVCDGDPVEQVLLRFNNLFGSGANQIPLGSSIVSATLTLRVGGGANDQSANAVNLHRLLAGWLGPDVWSVYGDPPWNSTDGIQADGTDALPTADATATMSTASTAYSVDVTTSLRAWALNPPTNYGWVILPTGTDGLRLESSESTTASYRPLLSVTYAAPAGQCTTDLECSDGVWCNGAETCNLSTQLCQAGPARNCDDAIACTTDSCNETTDSCDHTPSSAACDDSNVCTDDVCSLTLGCQHTNNAASCSDSNACTTADTCSAGTCVGGPAPNCNDGIACTNDSCDTGNGCTHLSNCPGNQTCNPGTGLCETSTVPPLPILAGATWSYYKGSLEPPANWSALLFDDASWLTGPSGFGYGTDCAASRGTTLDDMANSYVSVYMRRLFLVGNPALVTSLTLTADYDDGFVVYINGTEVARRNVVGTPPAYGQLATADHECSVCNGTCNAAESIDLTSFKGLLLAGNNVIAIQAHNVTAASTDFTVLPTLSSTESSSGCTSDGQCDDGLYCNGAETCNLGTSTCQAGTAPSCGDAFSCTTDSCNETTNSCDHVANDAACSDGNVCTGAETCNVTLGCQGGTPLNCDDTVACTSDTCDTALGCQHADNCTGGQVCNHTTGECSTNPVTMTFQQGDANAYGGTADTFIGSGLASQATTNPVVIDNDPTVEQALVRFDGIFGSGTNQIPVGSTITSATLTLRVGGTTNDESPSPVNFHRLLHPWVDSGLWADYGASPWNATAGIQADGTDALATADATATMSALNTSYPVDVTGSVQAWANAPSDNHGWVILPTGTDGLRLQSSESTTVSYRPLLSVTYTSPLPSCTSDPQCDDGLFCNGAETCNLGTLTCQTGAPPSCSDGVTCTVDTCNEDTDTCDHTPCAMTVAAEGSRYLAVTPPSGATTLALRVTSAGLACLPRYVAADGTLVSAPVYRAPADWGTVHVHAQPIAPGRLYTVEALRAGEVPIGSGAATTWAWGDTDNANGVDLFDILCVLDGSQNRFVKCTLYATDLRGPIPDGVVDNDDIQAMLDAYESKPYPESDPCSGVTP